MSSRLDIFRVYLVIDRFLQPAQKESRVTAMTPRLYGWSGVLCA